MLFADASIGAAWLNLETWLLIGKWLLIGAGLALLYWARPWLCGGLPRLTAFFRPHLLLLLLLAGTALWLFHQVVRTTSDLWHGHAGYWAAWTRRYPQLGILDWLWPWFPTLLFLLFILFLAARLLSRRLFHLVGPFVVLSVVLGVVLHDDAPPPSSSPRSVVELSEGDSLAGGPPLRGLPPLQQRQFQACLDTSRLFTPSPLFENATWRCALETLGVPAWKAVVEPVAPPPSPPRSIPDVAGERFAARVLDPTFHYDDTRTDLIAISMFGALLLLGYGWLDRVNLRRTLQPIRVASIEEGQNSDGTSKVRPDLENLMRECLHKQTPHIPAPLPGGPLQYWQDFVEQQSLKDNHWLTRAAAFVMRLLRPPSGMEIRGTLLSHEGQPRASVLTHEGQWVAGGSTHGIRIHMVDLSNGQTLIAKTFDSRISIEKSVEQAAYRAVERAVERCPVMPAWSRWEEGDGKALRLYHEGVEMLRKGAGNSSNVRQALALLHEAAKESTGSAMVLLQIAEALEALGDAVGALEIYLQVITRYPLLLVARFRLASVCRKALQWAPHLDVPSPLPEYQPEGPPPRKRLMMVLESKQARRLRRTTLLSRLIEGARRQHPTGAREIGLPPIGWWRPVPFREDDTHRMENALLNMAARALKQLECFGKRGVWLRCLASTTERRLFWHTLLWPPQRQRDLVLSMKIARRCVEWQQLQRLIKLTTEASHPLPRAIRFRKWRYQRTALRAAYQATSSARIRPNWLGIAHYHLACFFALQMDAKVLALPALSLPSKDPRDWSAHLSLNPHLTSQEPLQTALKWVQRLSSAGHAAAKARGASLAALPGSPSIASPPGVAASTPSDIDAEMARRRARTLEEMERLPQPGEKLRKDTDRHRRVVQGQHRRTRRSARKQLRKALRAARSLRMKDNLATLLLKARVERLRARTVRLLPRYRQQLSSSTSAPKSLHSEVLWLRQQLSALQRSLVNTERYARGQQVSGADTRRLERLRVHLGSLDASLWDLDDLHRLTLRLRHVRAQVEPLDRFLHEARALQTLSRRACDHLSLSMPDVDGPFATGTRLWMLNSPDFASLRFHDTFKVWAWVTLNERDIKTTLAL